MALPTDLPVLHFRSVPSTEVTEAVLAKARILSGLRPEALVAISAVADAERADALADFAEYERTVDDVEWTVAYAYTDETRDAVWQPLASLTGPALRDALLLAYERHGLRLQNPPTKVASPPVVDKRMVELALRDAADSTHTA